MAKAWYVIECVEGKSREVYGRLAAMGFAVWRPVHKMRLSARWRGRPLGTIARRPRYMPIFGRYLFINIEMSDSVFGSVIEQPGVYAWLCWAGSDDPAVVPPELIEHYRAIKLHLAKSQPAFAIGDMVRALDGPFAGFEGRVVRVDAGRTLCIEIVIFGRQTPVIFPVGHVELVELGLRPPIEHDVKRRLAKASVSAKLS